MDNAEFDKFADEYNAVLARNIALSGERPAYFAEDKGVALARAWRTLRGAAATPPTSTTPTTRSPCARSGTAYSTTTPC